LSIGTVEFKASTDLAGTVLGTVPAAGLRVRPGTSISLIVSNGQPPSATAPTPRTP
jgi:beta-lactam-binding protein with PASTA domain